MGTIGFPESLTVEFKSDSKKLSDNEIVEAVTAFANTEGGKLYVGVEDDGEITGVHADHRDTLRATAMIANRTVPPVPVSSMLIESDDVEYQLIEVPRIASVVATSSGKMLRRRLKADGQPENVPMFPFEITHRLSSLGLLDFSAQTVPDAKYEDLDALERERLRRIIKANRGEQRLLELTDEELDLSLKLATRVDRELLPTYTGLLLIGRQDRLAELMPTAESAFQVRQGTALKVNENGILPVLQAIEQAESLFNSWNSEDEIDFGFIRVAIPDFDKAAFREAVVNAYAHRDYSLLGRVRVLIDQEGITISNPGGFIEGVTVENILEAEPQGRNPVLADAMKRIGLAERTGRGIDRIMAGSLLYGRQAPSYRKSSATNVSLFIARGRPDKAFLKSILQLEQEHNVHMSAQQLLILNTLRTLPSIDEDKVAEKTGLEVERVPILLQTLSNWGAITTQSRRGNASYQLALAKDSPTTNNFSVKKPTLAAEEYESEILELVLKQGFVTRADITTALGVNNNKAYYLLRRLVDAGRLKKQGQGKGTTYSLI